MNVDQTLLTYNVRRHLDTRRHESDHILVCCVNRTGTSIWVSDHPPVDPYDGPMCVVPCRPSDTVANIVGRIISSLAAVGDLKQCGPS